MKALITAGTVMLLMVAGIFLFGNTARADSLPQLNYLGDGPGSFQTSAEGFVIKERPLNFFLQPGPTFQARPKHRVWEQNGAQSDPPALWHEAVDFGPIEAGCIVDYVGIDDDIDERVNTWYVDDLAVQQINQGMVFSGSFVVPKDGHLRLVVEDSVAGWSTLCDATVTPTPTATNTSEPTATSTATPTNTATATATPTNTPTPSATPTGTLPPTLTPSVTPTETPTKIPTATPTPTLTPTSTATPTATIPPTITPTVTPTPKPVRQDACVRINFDTGGDVARRGLYVVEEVGGRKLAEWYALDGWQDSGWIYDIDISHENVYVKVLYYSGPGASPVEMVILNHAPDSPYGWMSWGACHAQEVAWPDETG